MKTIPVANRSVLLGKHTSRLNKFHLVIGWTHFNGWYIDWKWAGAQFNSRMLFRFAPDEAWVEAKSYEEDLQSTYKFGKEK